MTNEYSVGLLKEELKQWNLIINKKPRDLQVIESIKHSLRVLMASDVMNSPKTLESICHE
jgi:hypothetical protein